MSINYADIRERREKVEAERLKRANLVLVEAQNLVDEYQISLGLEKMTWTDITGLEIPYVFVGKTFDGNFRKTNLNSVELNEKYGLDFTIATVIDDSPRGGSLSAIDIHLRIKDTNGTVLIEVREDGKLFNVIQTDNKYKDVCEEIKLQVLLSVNDPALTLEEYLNNQDIPY